MKGQERAQCMDNIPYISFYQSYFCFYCWIIFSLSLIAYEHLRIINPPMIYDSWNQNPIVDVTFNSNCSYGFFPAINYTFPQDQIKCDCSQANSNGFQYSGIYAFTCSQQQQSQGCVTSNAYPKQKIRTWPSLQNGILCYRRLSSPLRSIQKNQCNKSEIQCSTGIYKICVSQNGTCPIYDVQFTQNKNGQVQLNLSRNSSNNFPISSFVIKDISGICAQNVNSSTLNPCVQGDNTYNQMDVQNSSSIYMVNNINATKFVQGNYSLNTQSYNSFEFDLCNQGQFEFFRNLDGETIKLKNFQKFVLIMLGGFATIYAGVIALTLGLKLVGCPMICEDLDTRSQQYRDIYKLWICSKWFFNFCCVITIVISYILQSTYLGQIQDFISSKCSNSQQLLSISNYQTQFVNQVHQFVMIVFFLSIITIIGHSIMMKRMLSFPLSKNLMSNVSEFDYDRHKLDTQQ